MCHCQMPPLRGCASGSAPASGRPTTKSCPSPARSGPPVRASCGRPTPAQRAGTLKYCARLRATAWTAGRPPRSGYSSCRAGRALSWPTCHQGHAELTHQRISATSYATFSCWSTLHSIERLRRRSAGRRATSCWRRRISHGACCFLRMAASLWRATSGWATAGACNSAFLGSTCAHPHKCRTHGCRGLRTLGRSSSLTAWMKPSAHWSSHRRLLARHLRLTMPWNGF
mmetsp:Transcript_38920/g.111035  ORF Transcript_38920/g.111035 Transcript_38920/m.111035 type:complete len:228 (-) Transcript_38920:1770-2453(-)